MIEPLECTSDDYCFILECFLEDVYLPKKHLYVTLPIGDLIGRVRYDTRKAERAGIVCKKVSDVGPLQQGILDIFCSKEGRRGLPQRFVNIRPTLESFDVREHGWPVERYDNPKCPVHYLEFWGSFAGSALVGFMEVGVYEDIVMVLTVLGHGDWFKHGVMNHLFLNVMNEYPGKRFSYGRDTDKAEKAWLFLEGLKLTNYLEVEAV